MADTTFVNNITLSDADWFNDVNRLHYTILNDPADAAAVKTALSAASSGVNADITSMTALTAPTVAANPIRATDLQAQLATAFTTGGTSMAFTLTPTPASAANATNQRFRIKFHTAAGTTPTLAVSGQPALNLKYKDSAAAKQAITSVQVPSGWISDVENDGTDWVVLDIPPPRESINVKDFGAVGNGVADDTAAIQAAISSLTIGGSVYFPAGDYFTNSVITIAVESVVLVGAGRSATRIIANHISGEVFRFTRSYCGIKRIMIWGTATRIASSDTTAFGLRFECDDAADSATNRTRYCNVEDCRIVSQPAHGIAFVGSVLNGSVVNQCYIQSNKGHGVVLDRGGLTGRSFLGGSGPFGVLISNCEIHGNGGNAVATGSPTDTATSPAGRIVLQNLDVSDNATNAATRYSTEQIWMRGTNNEVNVCGIYGATTGGGIYVAGRNCYIKNNRFLECTLSVAIKDDTALSGLSTIGIFISGLSVINVSTPSQNPAVTIASGASGISIKNWLGSYITSLHTAGFQVEVERSPQIVVKTADTIINNNAVLADDPHLKFWVNPSEEIAFHIRLQHISDNTGSDLQIAVTSPSGASIRYGVPNSIKIDAADAVVNQSDIAVSGTAIIFGSTTTRRNAVIDGYCANGATAGYVTVQWAQSVAIAANTTVYTHSILEVIRRQPS